MKVVAMGTVAACLREVDPTMFRSVAAVELEELNRFSIFLVMYPSSNVVAPIYPDQGFRYQHQKENEAHFLNHNNKA